MKDGFLHCKPREMRVVEVRTNDRYWGGPARLGSDVTDEEKAIAEAAKELTTIVLSSSDAPNNNVITLSVKTKNISKFPTVGDTISVDITLNALGA